MVETICFDLTGNLADAMARKLNSAREKWNSFPTAYSSSGERNPQKPFLTKYSKPRKATAHCCKQSQTLRLQNKRHHPTQEPMQQCFDNPKRRNTGRRHSYTSYPQNPETERRHITRCVRNFNNRPLLQDCLGFALNLYIPNNWVLYPFSKRTKSRVERGSERRLSKETSPGACKDHDFPACIAQRRC